MPFAPCNIRLEQLIERQAKVKAAGHERRQTKIQRGKMPREVAENYERFDAAVLRALQVLNHIEQNAPEVVERFAKASAAGATP